MALSLRTKKKIKGKSNVACGPQATHRKGGRRERNILNDQRQDGSKVEKKNQKNDGLKTQKRKPSSRKRNHPIDAGVATSQIAA